MVKLPSGEQRAVLLRCTATIGALSNPAHKNIKVRRPLQLGLRQHILPFPEARPFPSSAVSS